MLTRIIADKSADLINLKISKVSIVLFRFLFFSFSFPHQHLSANKPTRNQQFPLYFFLFSPGRWPDQGTGGT